ncbi:MAG TPA: diguanylate cyclase [Anaeromyxobacteraceae bacterium]|nr:diguanylate cyclase [Anaeromyxobacteraceae bacterium]
MRSLRDDLARSQHDCAQMIEATRRLREAAERREEILASCARDLRGPAEKLLLHTRALLRGGTGSLAPAQAEAIEAIARESRQLLHLADDLLALRALDSGAEPLERATADLVEVAAAACDQVGALARDRGVRLTRDFPSGPIPLTVDALRLREALATLLARAVEQSRPGAELELALASLPSAARITLAPRRPPQRPPSPSEGRRPQREGEPPSPGASPRLLARIGGLGLALSQAVVDLHGGILEIEGDPAHPEAIRIDLPDAPLSPTRGRPREGDRARLLVVEDDADARSALTLMLEGAYDVDSAPDGEQALQLCRSDPPDLVLMDVFMPRMDGFAALAALRTDPATAEVPVILVSGRGDDLTRAGSLDLGAVDFMQKPFSERELKARIDRTLRLTRRQRQLRELAQTDPLTGLPNRRAFRTQLAEELKRTRRGQGPLSCVMIDMDHLKPVNDALGHAAGDRAIASLAEAIRTELRETDFGARYGGDEFVVLLPHTGAAEARVFAERLRTRLQQTALELDGHTVPLRASFGVASLEDDPDGTGDELVQRADAALYEAKRAGRGGVAMREATLAGLQSGAHPPQ